MTLWKLAIKELWHRKGRFGAGVLSMAIAIGSLTGALALLESHRIRTREILDAKEKALALRLAGLADEMRKAMLSLGFNVVILPREQNLADFYANDYAAMDMPEEYVTRLARSKLITVRHLLPSLQQKVEWPEIRRSVILFGTRGEAAAAAGDSEKPMAQPVPEGSVVLGQELHRQLNVQTGDTVRLFGRSFTVSQCQPARGNKDDITVWVNLAAAQEILDKKGRINAILAVECRCAWADLAKVRQEIEAVLPDTQVIERSSEALARAEARLKVDEDGKLALALEARHRLETGRERERMAGVLVPVILVACAAWIVLLTLGDVRARRTEIGILRSVGLRSGQIVFVFLAKAGIMGFVGGLAGLAAGLLAGARLGGYPVLPHPAAVLPALLLTAPFLSLLCSWIPAMMAARQDPADILREP